MPRQNRVTPFGEIIATPERGTFMGNRGILHDAEGNIRRPWQVKRWLVCVLEFRGRHRAVMAPNRYTELFFLDEATALAAGHRPCSECRHDRFLAFCNAWKSGNRRKAGSGRPAADEIDCQLHDERVNPDSSKRSYQAELDDLPDGVFVARGHEACLLWKGSLLIWSPGSYKGQHPRPKGDRVVVLTPKSTVAAIRAGYVPVIHPSVEMAR